MLLELFNNLFMNVAEQTGAVLRNTAQSVNIKERLDFSCAIFDATGALVANAPHVPVHLGAMGESVRTVLANRATTLRPGDVVALNNPFNGGTHLPDLTVITPVFDADEEKILFFVGSRGHHADIGGTVPGSTPPDSHTLEEEGVVIDDFLLVQQGNFQEVAFRALLAGAKYPARSPDVNVADIKAQVAANEKRRCRDCGASWKNSAGRRSRRTCGTSWTMPRKACGGCLTALATAEFSYVLDDGARRCMCASPSTAPNAGRSWTSPVPGEQRKNNFNAPPASHARGRAL